MINFLKQENIINCNIFGKVYTSSADKLQVIIAMAKKQIMDFSAKVSRGEATIEEIGEIIVSTQKRIDEIFGEGVFEEIFKDKTVSVHDCTDLVMYIIAVSNQFEESKKTLYESYSAGNREARRK